MIYADIDKQLNATEGRKPLGDSYLLSKYSFHAGRTKRPISGEMKGKTSSATATCWLLTDQPALERKGRKIWHYNHHSTPKLINPSVIKDLFQPSLGIAE